ncbi:MAG TPA: histidinol-phosphate transaminase [Candidatus Angelobacter sp.]|nr:histidinol-phosphate transaminase [Candidatus Angelobacter sp.]
MTIHLPVRKAILNRRTYEAPAEGRSGKVRLDFNENTSGCAPAVRRALRKLTAKQIAMYPEYEAPTGRLARYFRVRPEELLLTNGGDDALRVFFDTFVEPGTSILICHPTFPMYRYYAEIAGARVIALRYGQEMEFPLDAVIAGLRKKPRVLFIANPNNPTGTLLGERELHRILRAASHTVVVMDEAYAEFSNFTAVPWIRMYPQLFIARTFSKVAGLAALRLGAVIACEKSLALVRRAMPPFPVNLAALVAAEAAIADRATMKTYVHEVKRLRVWLATELQRLNVQTFRSAGNFLLANFGPEGPALFRKLERQGILLRDRSKDIGPGFVRITIGTASEMALLLRLIRRESKLFA